MSLRERFVKFAADLREKRAREDSYRRAYKVLNAAIYVGDTDAVHTLLEDRVVDINKPPRGTIPAIAMAVQRNRDDILDLLLNEGADPNTSLSERGYGYAREVPLLSLAIGTGNEYAARTLLAHPDIDPTKTGHLTAFGASIYGMGGGFVEQERPQDLARKQGMEEIAKLIEAHPAVKKKAAAGAKPPRPTP